MTTVGSGKYTYTFIQDWAKLPPGETFAMVSAVATDSQDRVYGFQRKDPPIVIFDRQGHFLSSWGNGAFLFAHGISIANDIVYLTDLCGLCIEACPTRALTMTNEYELADDTREKLIYEKQDLLAPLLPGMEEPPHPMRLGDSERDYYLRSGAGLRGSSQDQHVSEGMG